MCDFQKASRELIEKLDVPIIVGGTGLYIKAALYDYSFQKEEISNKEVEKLYEDKSNEVMTDEVLARLVTFPNVVVTSHQGYFTKEAMEAIANVTMENARALFNGEELVNEVKA